MRIVLAVIDDLFQFARTMFFGIDDRRIVAQERTAPEIGLLQPSLLPSYKEKAQQASPVAMEGQETFSSPGSLYFVGVEKAHLHTDPVVAFDVVMGSLSYGDQVRMLKIGGRWAYIKADEKEGWIFKDALREQAKDVFPLFEDGKVYDAMSEETKKLRLCIHDMFWGDKSSLLLTDAEYVTYKLQRKQRMLPWTEERPRTPGTWQKKLRGCFGVHIGIRPKTDSVMEYIIEDIGYVAYVEAVFPDDSIKLSAVGLLEEGVFSETILAKEQWKELRPVFIETN
jgi:hypothetical protein